MSYLVDGNNVMAQRVGWHRDKPRARRTLMDELADFAARKHARVTVVFDGAPEAHFPDGATYRGVKLHYAARGSNADERIKSLVERARERRTLRVVTSDRALADYVRRCGVEVVRSGDFRRLLEGEGGEAPPEEKREVRPDDTAHWLRYFGVEADDE
ncbi:MAG: NYN domain-containing protein [Acidobacteria bacterium]|nr:NYN domain-containing protein [Acidobacteriota bacterium]